MLVTMGPLMSPKNFILVGYRPYAKMSDINFNENDVLFSNDRDKLGKRNSECSYQESNLRPSDY